jgi:diguanylate cyclase (GGDEF)-like protein
MLSLKKCMESQAEQLLDVALESYRSALLAVGQSAALAHSHSGEDLQNQLVALQQSLCSYISPDLMRQTEQQLEGSLQNWAQSTAEYFKQKTAEVKEILLLMAAAADGVSARDQRYTAQLTQISSNLQKVSNLDDLTTIRRSLSNTSAELTKCVAKMEQDGRETVEKLKAEIQTYQARVLEVEKIAFIDQLTGLSNRREVERQLELRVARKTPFSVLLFDLNGFKPINDQYGHAAGDELLKQFASELRRFFRTLDTVGRWGGDEFVVILDCDFSTAKSRLQSLEKWLYGSYTIDTPTGTHKVEMSAVSGAVEWKRGETAAEVLGRADAAMYQRKKAVHQ